jgi:hypothetical protein
LVKNEVFGVFASAQAFGRKPLFKAASISRALAFE